MKKLMFIMIVLMLFSTILRAQEKEINKANKLFAKKNYTSALPLYTQALNKGVDPDKLTLQNIANCYYYQNKFGEAKEIFDKMSRDEMNPESQVNYGVICTQYGNYTKAVSMFESAQRQGSLNALLNTYKQSCTWAQANNMPSGYTVSKSDIIIDGVSFGLNFYDDGIVYSLSDPASKGKDPEGYAFTNINFVTYDDAVTGVPAPFNPAFNMVGHEGAVSFNPTQEIVFFTAFTYSKKGVNMQIYESQKKDNIWSKPKALPFNNKKYSCAYPTINQESTMMYFASDMPGGAGGMDLYYVEKVNGKWGKPVNCGKEINTSGDEVYPFLSFDGSLYFSSNGRIGYGGLDIYYASGQKSTWMDIINMQKPINSSRNDFAYVISPFNTEKSFLSSNRDKDGRETSIFIAKKVVISTEPDVSSGSFDDLANQNKSVDDFYDNAEGGSSANQNASDSNDGNDIEGELSSVDDYLSSQNGSESTSEGDGEDDNGSGSLSLEQHLREMMGADAIIYRVQFLSSRDYLNKVKLDETGDIVYRYLYNGLYRYTVGEFYEVEPAIELKEKMINMGYKDAFVVAFRGTERVLDVQIYKRDKEE